MANITLHNFRPLASLQHLVESYWAFEQDADALVSHPHIVLPSPMPAVIVPYPLEGVARRAGLPSDTEWWCRQVAHERFELRGQPATGLFGVTFQPAGFYQLFGLSMASAGQAGQALTGHAAVFLRALSQRVAQVRTAPDRVAVAERLLLARLRCGEVSTPMEALATAVLVRHGQVSVDEMAAQSNLCRRQFERRFREVVGVAPKLFAEISRFRNVMTHLHSAPTINWQDVTHACGYFDQAHFIREFRRFAGKTPASYTQREFGPDAPA